MRRRWLAVALGVAAGGAGLALAADDDTRQDEVRERGAQTMPFSLEKTLHVFTPTSRGGVQRVIARKARYTRQIRLVRRHLRKEARAFARGDFSDPEGIHGEDMPGLNVLREHDGALEVRYRDLRRGGRIRFRTRSFKLLHALHEWFAAQVSDHGEDATTGHAHGERD